MLKRKHRLALLTCGLLSAASAPALATTLLRMSFEDMAVDSAVVVVAEAAGTRVEQTENGVYTVTTFNVEDSVAGDAGATVDVAVPGGVFTSPSGIMLRESYPDAPAFAIGSEQFLFLGAGSEGAYQVVGFSQGALNVVETAQGKAVRIPGENRLVGLEEAKSRARAAKANGQGRGLDKTD
jgi:hypothetical protein